MLRSLLKSQAAEIGILLYIIAIIIGGIVENPWIYHPIFFACLFCTGFAATICAFRGRTPNPTENRRTRILNAFGTTIWILIGAFLFTAYGLALYSKTS